VAPQQHARKRLAVGRQANDDRRISDRVVDTVGSSPPRGREDAVTSRTRGRTYEPTLVAVFARSSGCRCRSVNDLERIGYSLDNSNFYTDEFLLLSLFQ
jgi:hypothetical protein